MLKSDKPGMAQGALMGLRGIGSAVDAETVKGAASRLVELMFDSKFDERSRAAETLGAIHCVSEEAIDGLRKALKDRDVGSWAVVSLGKLGPAAKAAVPDLIEYIKSDEHNESGGVVMSSDGERAVEALGQIGPEARDAIPFLQALQSQHLQDPKLPNILETALKNIDGTK